MKIIRIKEQSTAAAAAAAAAAKSLPLFRLCATP